MPDAEERRPGEGAASKSPAKATSHSLAPPADVPPTSPLADYVAHFRGRVVQDALSEATSAYWERRAEAFEGARPSPNEFHGNETREELRGRWLRLTGIAAACRA